MQSVDQAIYSVLSGDAILASLAPGGVWRQLAPLDTATPLIVFRTPTPDEDRHTLGRLAYRLVTIEVAAVDRSPSAEAAQAALARAEELLTDAALSAAMTGWSVGYARRRSATEAHFLDAGGSVWQTTAATFRLMVIPA